MIIYLNIKDSWTNSTTLLYLDLWIWYECYTTQKEKRKQGSFYKIEINLLQNCWAACKEMRCEIKVRIWTKEAIHRTPFFPEGKKIDWQDKIVL